MLLIQPLIVLYIHPHRKQQGLKSGDEQKGDGQHGQRGNVMVCKNHDFKNFQHIRDREKAQYQGKMIEQEERVKIPNQIFNPQSHEKKLQQQPGNARDDFEYLHFGLLADVVHGFDSDFLDRAKCDVQLYQQIVGHTVLFINLVYFDGLEGL